MPPPPPNPPPPPPAAAATAAEPAELVGAARERRGVVGTVADREDAHAPAGGLFRRGLRVDPPVVRAVGEHDDHVVGVAGAAVAGDGRAGRRDRRVDLGDGVERGQDALADGGAERGGQAAERADQLPGVRGGRDEDDGGAREGDEADVRAARLGLDESGGRLLGGGDPVRLHVRGAHGAGDVQGEHDRRGRRRDRHGRLRAGGTDREHGQAKRQERCGDAPPPARAAGHGRPDERDRGHPDHGAPAPAPCQPPGREHQRNDEEREQRPRPGEGHSDHPARTDDGEHGARGEQREGQGDERAGQRQRLVGDGEPQVDGRGDPVELARVRCGMVRAAGGLRDRLEGGHVERGEQVVAVDVDGGARGGADPDGVDVHAGLLGHRGGRVGAGIGTRAAGGPGFVLPVGEQHDRGRGPVADVRRAAVAADGDRFVRDRGQRGEDRVAE